MWRRHLWVLCGGVPKRAIVTTPKLPNPHIPELSCCNTALKANDEIPQHAPECQNANLQRNVVTKPIPSTQRKKYSPLHVAIMNGSAAVVKAILARHPKAAQLLTEAGETPIFLAAAYGHAEIAGLLAQQWPQGVLQPVGDSTPLLIAGERGHNEAVNVLTLAIFTSGQNVDSPPLLHSAVESGNVDTVAMLARQCPAAVSHRFGKSTPLHVAIERGDLAAVKMLLGAQPAAVRDIDGDGKAPIFLAAERGHVGIMALVAPLWPKGAFWFTNKLNALQVACRNGHAGGVEVLLQCCPDLANEMFLYPMLSPLYLVAEQGRTDIVASLLRHEVPDRARCEVPTSLCRANAFFALDVAIKKGHTAVVTLLLAHVQVSTRDPKILIDAAIQAGNVEVVRMLFQWWHAGSLHTDGCDTSNLAFNDHLTGLSSALRNGYTAMVGVVMEFLAKLPPLLDHSNNIIASALLDGAKRGDTELVRSVVSCWPLSPFVAVWYSQGSDDEVAHKLTLLDVAIKHGHTSTVEAILRSTSSTVDKNTILVAWSRVDTSMMRLLLSRTTIWTRRELLNEACASGNVQLAKGMIEASDTDTWDSTPLMKAAEEGHIGILTLLFNSSPVFLRLLTQLLPHQESPMEAAIKNWHVETVKCLLKYWPEGALREGKSTPLQIAIERGQLEIVEALLDAQPSLAKKLLSESMTPIYAAVECDKPNIVALLLRRWPEGALQGLGKWTPLLAAIENQSSECVKLLVGAHPATARELSPEGVTPIYLASQWGNVEIVEILMRCWPEGVRQRTNNQTPLHISLSFGNVAAAQTVLAACPEAANDVMEEGLKPLHLAIKRNWCVPLVELLTRCSVEHQTTGLTPLLYAVQLNRSGVIKILLNIRPAWAQDTTAEGKTAIWLAASLGHANQGAGVALAGGRLASVRRGHAAARCD